MQDIAISSLFNSLLLITLAVTLVLKGRQLLTLVSILWSICIIKEIFEFIICIKNIYSYFLLFSLLISCILMLIYYKQQNGRRLGKWSLHMGIGIFAIRELVIAGQVTAIFIERLPYYTHPFLAAVKLYLGVFVYIVLGSITWLQKET